MTDLRTLSGLITDTRTRVTLLERRRARGGSGGALPERLSSGGEQTGDWNSSTAAGFYWSTADALNGPSAEPVSGIVSPLGDDGGLSQTVWSRDSPGTSWTRSFNGVSWSAWVPGTPTRLNPGGSWLADLNTAIESGWYWGSNSSQNRPTGPGGTVQFVLRVDAGAGGRIVQTIESVSTPGAEWKRVQLSGVWSDWRLVSWPRTVVAIPWDPAGGVTPGNGVGEFMYEVADGVCIASLRFNLGTTSAITGDIRIALPLTADGAGNVMITGTGRIGIGSNNYTCTTLLSEVNNFGFVRVNRVSGSNVIQAQASSTIPASWVSGSFIEATFVFPVTI